GGEQWLGGRFNGFGLFVNAGYRPVEVPAEMLLANPAGSEGIHGAVGRLVSSTTWVNPAVHPLAFDEVHLLELAGQALEVVIARPVGNGVMPVTRVGLVHAARHLRQSAVKHVFGVVGADLGEVHALAGTLARKAGNGFAVDAR